MIGYSVALRDHNRKADKRNLGVRLGRHCIAENVSVKAIAEIMGVSRQTIYNWFTGVGAPSKRHAELIAKIYPTVV